MDYQYENFNLNNGLISIEMIIAAIFVGAVIASFAAIYNKRILGDFVRAIIKSGANSADKAKTVSELGFEKDIFMRSALRDGTALRRTVLRADDIQPGSDTQPEEQNIAAQKTKKGRRSDIKLRIDLETARFYIPEEGRYRAEVRYDKKGTDWLGFVIAVLVFAALAALVNYVLPELLAMLDNLITDVKPEQNYI